MILNARNLVRLIDNFNSNDIYKLQKRCLCRSSASFQSLEVFVKEKYKKHTESNVKQFIVTEENQYKLLEDVVTPLCNIPYEEQVKMKWLWSRDVLNTFATTKYKKLCKLNDVIKSPVIYGYRNKSEISIRNGIDGNPKTLGLFIGSPSKGNVVSVPVTNLVILPQKNKDITQLYQEFIRRSPLPACHDLHDGGFWRGITVKTNSKGETMAIITVHPQDKSEEELQEHGEHLRKFFEEKQPDLTSLYLQPSNQVRSTNEIAPYIHLSGERYLYETLHGYQFRISPDSFFQVNKQCAELMYTEIFRMAQVKPFSVLLDLCCGTGAISILGSEYVHSCIGLDLVEQSIEDAKTNAKINNLENCYFYTGRVEKILPKVLDSLDSMSDIICVLNPGRCGVTKSVIKVIRESMPISKLIYVSCKADFPGTISNFRLLHDQTFSDVPGFSIRAITPVDLFPHTKHCELLLLFER